MVSRGKSLSLVASGLLTACAGCGVDFGYVLPVVVGQAELLLRSVSISEALRSGRLSAEQKAKLILIRDVRKYAGEEIGLDIVDNYTLYYDSGGQPVAYNLSASARDAFRPKTWSFPFVGSIPYLGFFDRPAAVAEFTELKRLGYDVFLYPVEAYSGFAWLPNPVLSPMLERDDIFLVDTVMHELLHSTIFRENDTTFNESLATFVGRTAMVDYFRDRRPDEPEWVEMAAKRNEDTDRYNAFIFELYGELESFYASDLDRQGKIIGREALYQAGRERFVGDVLPLMNIPELYEWMEAMPGNNAWMLANYRYNLDLDVFAQVHATTGFDWRESLRVFGRAAKSRDPYEYLRAWMAEDAVSMRSLEESTPSPPAAAGDAKAGPKRGPCPFPAYGRRPELP